MSPETQVRLFFGGLAVVMFVLASWIFWTDGDVSRGLGWLGARAGGSGSESDGAAPAKLRLACANAARAGTSPIVPRRR